MSGALVEPREHRLRGSDGGGLRLLEWSTQGVPLLLLHGFGNEAHVWDDLVPDLTPYYRVLALDQRGHGESDPDPDGRYDHLSMANDAAAVLDAVGADRVVVIGHSMGGRVAMRLAGLAPERMAGLVVVDAGPDLDARGVTRIGIEASRQPTRFDSLVEFSALVARNYPAARADVVERIARHALRRRPDGRFELKLASNLGHWRTQRSPEELERYSAEESRALWGILRKLPCPTLLVRGAASDVLSPETADAMVEAIPDGRLAVVERAGHSVMVDNPDGLRRAVCAFVLGDEDAGGDPE